MKIKVYVLSAFYLLFLNGFGLLFAMDYPGMHQGQLRPVDRVFLNACKNNKNIHTPLSLGANINAIDPDNGYTALHYAALNGNFDTVKFLFNHTGVSAIDVRNAEGLDPVDIAHNNNHTAIAQYMLDSALLVACLMRLKTFPLQTFCNRVTSLVKRGANIDAANNDVTGQAAGFTPLLYACLHGDIDKIKCLVVDNGADVNKKSALGITPLYMVLSTAVGGVDESKLYQIAQFLIDHGADVTIKGPGNHTILQAAVRTKSFEFVNAILKLAQNKMDLNIPDDNGHNAFSDAVAYRRKDLLPLLLDAGILPINNKEGISSLHEAAIKNYPEIVEWLINKGLDVNALDKNGQTPLHYAAEYASYDIVKALLDAGADPRMVDNQGKTATQLAAKNPDKNIKKLLEKARKKPVKKPQIPQRISVVPLQPMPAKPEGKKGHKKRKKSAKEKEIPAIETQTSDVEVTAKKAVGEELPSVVAPMAETVSAVEVPTAIPAATDKPKKSKPSLSGYVQKKVENVLAPAKKSILTAGKSYAVAAGAPKRAPEPQSITLEDNNVQIIALIPFGWAGNPDNPLIGLQYSQHVKGKMQHQHDTFHNFSPAVEEQLGKFVRAETIADATKHHSAKMRYTIRATMIIFGGKKEFPGRFEFIVRDGIMKHRFFKPDKQKSVAEEKSSLLLLPPPSSDNKELSQ